MKFLLFLPLLLTTCQSSTTLEEMDFLIGTWQIENKSTFEEWKKEKGQLKGISYKLVDRTKQITETLLIRKSKEGIIYEAKVSDQNEGKTIPFILNMAVKDKVSFENLAHDFPKKIQYQVIDKQQLYVRVLGANGEGFSYHSFLQE